LLCKKNRFFVVAVDTVGAAIMGFPLEEVEHLMLAGKELTLVERIGVILYANS